jgi:hypothetical protein
MKILLTLALGFLVLCPLACGKKENLLGTASVSGKVIWDKIPLQFGAVQFYSPELVHTGLIQNDGSYKLDHLPIGQVTICIRTRGELYADSRGDEELRRMLREGMKGKDELPEGMSLEELKQMMMAKGGGAQGKPGIPGGFRPMKKGPKEAEFMASMPMVKGVPLLHVQEMHPEALRKIGEVHDKYGEFKNSSLTYTVVAGDQSHDIILK